MSVKISVVVIIISMVMFDVYDILLVRLMFCWYVQRLSVLVVMLGLFLVIMQIRLNECSDLIILMNMRFMSGVFSIGSVMYVCICQVVVQLSCVVLSGFGGSVFSSFRIMIVKNSFYCYMLISVIVYSVRCGLVRNVVCLMLSVLSSQFRMLVSGVYMNFQMNVVDMCGSSIGMISISDVKWCQWLCMCLNRNIVSVILISIVLVIVMIFYSIDILIVFRKCWFDVSWMKLCRLMYLLFGQCSMWLCSVRLIVVIVGMRFRIVSSVSVGVRNIYGRFVWLWCVWLCWIDVVEGVGWMLSVCLFVLLFVSVMFECVFCILVCVVECVLDVCLCVGEYLFECDVEVVVDIWLLWCLLDCYLCDGVGVVQFGLDLWCDVLFEVWVGDCVGVVVVVEYVVVQLCLFLVFVGCLCDEVVGGYLCVVVFCVDC